MQVAKQPEQNSHFVSGANAGQLFRGTHPPLAAGRGAGRGGPARRKRARPGRQGAATTEPRGRARRKNGAAPAARRQRRAGRPSREPRGDATPAARRPRPAAEVSREGAEARGEASRPTSRPVGAEGECRRATLSQDSVARTRGIGPVRRAGFRPLPPT